MEVTVPELLIAPTDHEAVDAVLTLLTRSTTKIIPGMLVLPLPMEYPLEELSIPMIALMRPINDLPPQ